MSALIGAPPATLTPNDGDGSGQNEYVMIGDSGGSPVRCMNCNSSNAPSAQKCLRCGNQLIASTSAIPSHTVPNDQAQQSYPQPPPRAPPSQQKSQAAYRPPPAPPSRSTIANEGTANGGDYSAIADPDHDTAAAAPADNPGLVGGQYSNYDPHDTHLVAPIDQTYKAEEQLFGNFLVRGLYTAVSLLLLTLFSFTLWFRSDQSIQYLTSAERVCGTAAFFTFLGAVFGVVYTVMSRNRTDGTLYKLVKIAAIWLYLFGGFFYFVGACAVAGAWNRAVYKDELGDISRAKITAFSGIWFAELMFVSCHAFTAGIDIWRRKLNTHGLRLVLTSVYLWCMSVLLFFCVAIWSSYNSSKIAGYGLQAFGYFFITLLLPLQFAMKLCVNTPSERFELIVTICLGVFTAFACFGYWALAGEMKGNGSGYGGYCVGFSFYLVLQVAMVMVDMHMEQYLPFADRFTDQHNNELEQRMIHKQSTNYFDS